MTDALTPPSTTFGTELHPSVVCREFLENAPMFSPTDPNGFRRMVDVGPGTIRVATRPQDWSEPARTMIFGPGGADGSDFSAMVASGTVAHRT